MSLKGDGSLTKIPDLPFHCRHVVQGNNGTRFSCQIPLHEEGVVTMVCQYHGWWSSAAIYSHITKACRCLLFYIGQLHPMAWHTLVITLLCTTLPASHLAEAEPLYGPPSGLAIESVWIGNEYATSMGASSD